MVDVTIELTVVVPVYRGAGNLRPLLSQLTPVLNSTFGSWEILFVDDGSPDATFEVIRELHHADSRIRGLRLKENRGQQNAVYAGICHARGKQILTMDDDGQHPPVMIPRMAAEQQAGCDLVYAVPRHRRRSLLLRTGTRLVDLFFTLFLQKPVDIKISSYRLLTREAALRISGERGTFLYVSALLFRLRPRLRVRTLFYDSPPGIPARPASRFRLTGRLAVFLRLLLTYGPLRFLVPRKAAPYEIAETLPVITEEALP